MWIARVGRKPTALGLTLKRLPQTSLGGKRNSEKHEKQNSAEAKITGYYALVKVGVYTASNRRSATAHGEKRKASGRKV